jgi:hypothetical protein
MMMIVGAAACGGADSDVRLEILELATGEYYGLSWGGTQVERFHVVAREGDPADADARAVIVSPQRTPPCELGDNVSRYLPLQPRSAAKYVIGSPSPVRIPVFDEVDDKGFGTLSFAGVDCERSPLSVPDTSASNLWRLYAPDLSTLTFAVRRRDLSLELVDPWKGKRDKVAEDVAWVWPIEKGFWTIEAGELVRRDQRGREQLRKGKQVRDLYLLGSDGEHAYVDERGLFLNRAGTEKKVTSDGCRLRTLDQFLPGAVAYLSPCDSFRLTVATPEGEVYHYAENVDVYDVQRGQLLFMSVSETTSTFWAVSPSKPDEPRRLFEVPRVRIEDLWNAPNGVLRLIVRQLDDSLTLLEINPSLTPVVPKIHQDRIVTFQPAQHALAFLDEDETLVMRDRDTLAVLHVAEGVTRSAFRFAFGGKATSLVYLSTTDPEALLGRLEMHVLTGDHFVIARDVREFRDVWWPERGVLYATGGEEPGIYFARVDIPCENTSETSFACGFQGAR